jgi:hypothetical protein
VTVRVMLQRGGPAHGRACDAERDVQHDGEKGNREEERDDAEHNREDLDGHDRRDDHGCCDENHSYGIHESTPMNCAAMAASLTPFVRVLWVLLHVLQNLSVSTRLGDGRLLFFRLSLFPSRLVTPVSHSTLLALSGPKHRWGQHDCRISGQPCQLSAGSPHGS